MPGIVLINLSTLERMAIIGELDRLSDASFTHFNTFESFRDAGEKGDGFVVSESEFIFNLDFFLPRKNKTVVIVNKAHQVSPSAQIEGMVKMINHDTDPTIVSEIIMSLTSISNEEQEIGELSSREKEVLRELAKGKTNKEIADVLYISVNTVITHRKNLSTKLGIRSVSGLSLYAMMNGLI